METLLDVVKVEATPDYLLHLEFENGEKRIFDMHLHIDPTPERFYRAVRILDQAGVGGGLSVE